MKKEWAFDMEHYTRITGARINFLNQWLPDLITSQGLKSALDVGCGVGYFSHYLAGLGLEVVALDGRQENVSEAQIRYPNIKFIVKNVEDFAVKELGSYDLTLCFGLLYHLENPFLAIRNLYALTGKILLIESMVTPSSFPVASLVDEVYSEDQSLNYVALVLSESGLVKMLYRVGFPYVYASVISPNHEDFHETHEFHRKRTILFTGKMPIELPFLRLIPEPPTKNLWLKPLGYRKNRFYRFLRKPWREKVITVRSRFKSLWFQLFPSIPLPVRLPYGGWWLAVNDTCSDAIFTNNYEKAEWRFVERVLKKGMIFIDIGAHHGFYTILAAKKVGSSGCVIAFEPSPRERGRLLLHLKLNHCTKLKVEPFTLSSQDGESTLFLVDGKGTGCNSLRPPVVSEPTKTINVSTMTLDNYLKKANIHHVDFIKMDVEGAELEVLKGAKGLLSQNSRPVVMAEVYDIRTNPWGYPASSIYDFLAERNYHWFSINSRGTLKPCTRIDYYEANLVAVPQERISEVNVLIESQE